jgi:hypothetical protein
MSKGSLRSVTRAPVRLRCFGFCGKVRLNAPLGGHANTAIHEKKKSTTAIGERSIASQRITRPQEIP